MKRILGFIFGLAIISSCSERDDSLLLSPTNVQDIFVSGRTLQVNQVYVLKSDSGKIPFDYEISDSLIVFHKNQSGYVYNKGYYCESSIVNEVGTTDTVLPEYLEKWYISTLTNKTYSIKRGDSNYSALFKECVYIQSNLHNQTLIFDNDRLKRYGQSPFNIYTPDTSSDLLILKRHNDFQIVTDESGNAFFDGGYIYIDVDELSLYDGNTYVPRIKFKIIR